MKINFFYKFKLFFLSILLLLFLSSCSNNFEDNLSNYLLDINYEVYFCQSDDCETELINFINSSKYELKCAFFELNLDSLIDLLIMKSNEIDLELLVDYRYEKYVKDLDFVELINRSGLMHNKYCISDNEKILTGSTNPTQNCIFRNYNNIVIFNSTIIANKYLFNFNEIRNYSRPKNTNNGVVYFCPGDCIKFVSNFLRRSNESIYFMAFAFTSKEIAIDILIKYYDGIEVKGLFNRLNAGSEHSTIHMFNYHDVDVKISRGQGQLHHKVFVIDEEIVITGSFNPSMNANNRNYENILVIKNKDIAKKFIDEFYSIYGIS